MKKPQNDLVCKQLLKYKEGLNDQNQEELDRIFGNNELPQKFRSTLQSISKTFQNKQNKIDELQELYFLYKDIAEFSVGDKQVTQQSISTKYKVTNDMKISAISLFQMIKKLKQSNRPQQKGKNNNEVKQRKEADEKIRMLSKKIADLQKIIKNGEENSKIKEQNLKKESEQNIKREKAQNLKELKIMEQRLKIIEQQSSENKKKKDALELSLSNKSKQLAKQILSKEPLNKELKSKNEETQILKGEIQKLQLANKQFQKIKEQLLMSQSKLKNQQGIKKKKQNQIKDLKKKITQLQKIRTEKEQSLKNKQIEVKNLRQQFQEYRLKNAQAQFKNDLLNKATCLIESSQILNKLYSEHYPNYSPFCQTLQLKHHQMETIQLKRFFQSYNNQRYAHEMLEQLKNYESAQIIHDSSRNKSNDFMKKIANKQNLLLFCLTESGASFGSFSELGFTNVKQKNRCFMFAAQKEKFRILKLKQGKMGVRQDNGDFLIFGNDEFVLQNRSSEVTVEFDPDEINQLDFEGSVKQRQQFLEMLGSAHKPIDLRQFKIFELSSN